MPRIEIPVTTLSGNPAGVARAATTANSNATEDHILSNIHEGMWLEVTNTIATPTDITFVTPGTVGGRAIADDTTTIAASATRLFGPFNKEVYGEALLVDVLVATLSLRGYQTVQQ